MSRQAILDAVERYYSGRFAEHGATARGVDWNSTASQDLRFVQLARLFDDDGGPFTVNDLGCGYGAFASFLEGRGLPVTYVGYELSPAMLDDARARLGDRAWATFRPGSELLPADYSVASGIFNVRLDFTDDEWARYVEDTIASLAAASSKGFAFNMLTSYSDEDKRRPDLYYADPRAMFDHCKRRHAPDVAVLHDYGLWEFTTIVRFRG